MNIEHQAALPTLGNVADRAGVTRLTARRALYGQLGVGAETRERVLAIAGELGYRPNSAAMAMRSGRFNCLALLISPDRYRGFLTHALLDGIVKEAGETEYSVTITTIGEKQMVSPTYAPAVLRQWMADGLLINYHFDIPPELDEMIKKHHIPAIWLNTRRDTDCVYIDDRQAGRIITEKLLKDGHTRIAYLDFTQHWDNLSCAHYSVIDRAAGYEDAMRDAGLPSQILRAPTAMPGREIEMAREWLSAADRPTAIAMYSATSATPLALAAESLGYVIGSDLALAAVDDPINAPMGIPMILASPDHERMGRESVAMLREMIEHPKESVPSRAIEAKTIGA